MFMRSVFAFCTLSFTVACKSVPAVIRFFPANEIYCTNSSLILSGNVVPSEIKHLKFGLQEGLAVTFCF